MSSVPLVLGGATSVPAGEPRLSNELQVLRFSEL
jgi:hypothetical protein